MAVMLLSTVCRVQPLVIYNNTQWIRIYPLQRVDLLIAVCSNGLSISCDEDPDRLCLSAFGYRRSDTTIRCSFCRLSFRCGALARTASCSCSAPYYGTFSVPIKSDIFA